MIITYRFELAARCGVPPTCITFNSVRRREIIVGLSDCSIHSYNIDSGKMLFKLPAYHRSMVLEISVHPGKSLALSCSSKDCFLWDTEKWIILRQLDGHTLALFKQVRFSPNGMYVSTSFDDGTICIWESDSFHLKWKLSLNDFPRDAFSDILAFNLTSCHACSFHGHILVYACAKHTLLVWDLVERRFMHEIKVLQFNGTSIKQLEFVAETDTVAVLSDDGTLVFVDVNESKQVGQLVGGDHSVSDLAN